MKYIKVTAGRDFLEALDRHVDSLLARAAGNHNGGRKTLDAGVLQLVRARI
jgi:hypothetical protein